MTATVHVLFESKEWLRVLDEYNDHYVALMVALGPARDEYQSLAELVTDARWFGWRRWLQPRWCREVAAYLRENFVDRPLTGALVVATAYRMLPEAWR